MRPCIGRRSLAGNVAWIAACLAAVLAAALIQPGGPPAADAAGGARGRVPDTPETVVLRLDRSEALAGLLELRQRLDRHPGDVAAASAYARLALQHYADTGDARFLGFAEGAIRHWQGDTAPPAPVWLIRGRILQTQHHFARAAEELERMLARHPDSIEAMLLAADAWRRAGRIDKARPRCAAIAPAGRADLASLCAADVFLSLGDARKALAAASAGRGAASGAVSDGVAQWMLAATGDAAAAAGRDRLAAASYRQALALPGGGIALHVAYADLLLGSSRPQEAMDALAGLPATDAVLLRRAMAAKQLGLEDFTAYRTRLLESFAEARALGAGRLHLREQAMFELHVEDNPAAALRLARENWEIQKGPEDAAILMQAADAAGATDTRRAVLAWRRQFQRHAG